MKSTIELVSKNMQKIGHIPMPIVNKTEVPEILNWQDKYFVLTILGGVPAYVEGTFYRSELNG